MHLRSVGYIEVSFLVVIYTTVLKDVSLRETVKSA